MYKTNKQDIFRLLQGASRSPCTRNLSTGTSGETGTGTLTTASAPVSPAAGTPAAVPAGLGALKQEGDTLEGHTGCQLYCNENKNK